MPGTRSLNQHDPLVRGGDPAPNTIDIADLAASSPGRPAALASILGSIDGPGYLCLAGVLGRSPVYAALNRQMREFFALADDDPVKQAVNAVGQANTNGWMPVFGEPAYQPGTLAHVESFDCGPEPTQPGRDNRWPAIDGFRESVVALWTELGEAGYTVMRAIADALGLETGFLADRCASEALSTMRLLHYPAIADEDRHPESVGIAAHTDFECITLIVQTAPGLELLDARDTWRDAPAGEHLVIVLFGDMLERWTNGRVRATGHRVRPRDFERYSIVKFFAVDDEVDVAPLPGFLGAERPAAYAPTRQSEHTRDELERAEANRDALARELEAGSTS
jgi:isopenicillin N synthase-like dioxygenase